MCYPFYDYFTTSTFTKKATESLLISVTSRPRRVVHLLVCRQTVHSCVPRIRGSQLRSVVIGHLYFGTHKSRGNFVTPQLLRVGILFWLWKWLLASLKWAPELSLDTTSICAHHIVQPLSSLYNVGSVALPEEDGSEKLPHSTIGPMFTEHISWVDGSFNMVESNKTGCHCFTNAMKG
jgi:hypothetical protein